MGGAMHKKMALALGACLALLIPVSSAAVPVSHTVGDATGWALPNSPSFYSSWASKESSFNVGDFLVFNFPGATQTVAEVTKSAYDSCSAVNPLTQVNNGPVNVTITSPGPHYYISTDAGHCLTGQKFSITVASPTAPAPKSATPSTPSGAMTPAASTPTATPGGKGASAPATTPMAAPGSTAMSPATSPVAAPGSTIMSPATTPMAAPAPAMSPTGAPISSISLTPATAPTAAASSPESSKGAPVGSADTPASEGPGAASNSSSAARTAALILLPVLLVVAPILLF